MWNSTVRVVFMGLNIVVVYMPMAESRCFDKFALFVCFGDLKDGLARSDLRRGCDTTFGLTAFIRPDLLLPNLSLREMPSPIPFYVLKSDVQCSSTFILTSLGSMDG